MRLRLRLNYPCKFCERLNRTSNTTTHILPYLKYTRSKVAVAQETLVGALARVGVAHCRRLANILSICINTLGVVCGILLRKRSPMGWFTPCERPKRPMTMPPKPAVSDLCLSGLWRCGDGRKRKRSECRDSAMSPQSH